MTRLLRDFRLIPVVLIAIGSLFVLKTAGLIFDGGYTLGQRMGSNGNLVVTTVPMGHTTELRSPSVPLDIGPAKSGPKLSWMQEMFNYPGGDVTGSVHSAPKPKEPPKEAAAQPQDPKPQPQGTVVSMDQPRPASAAERALLERLQERRQELDARARELDMRESMLKAAEKKLETQGSADREEGKGGSAAQRRDETEAARFKAVVTMYETMKPKDAAKIFDRLDIKVLLEMASQIKPQRMAEILAVMNPEAAERLTIELAQRNGADRTVNPANLPKIEGRPGG